MKLPNTEFFSNKKIINTVLDNSVHILLYDFEEVIVYLDEFHFV